MSQRRLALHASALSDAEYAVYTASLKDLVLGDPDAHPHQGSGEGVGAEEEDDGYFARMQMGVREARAWLRGRYAAVPVQTIDTILRFFSPALAPGDSMAGTEFFAALRLVVHANNGTMGAQDVDRGMAFVQADPTLTHSSTPTAHPNSNSTPSSRAHSPSKRYNPFSQAHLSHPQPLHPPPPPQHPQHPSLAHSAYASFRRESAASAPRSHGSSAHSQSRSQGHNPFARDASSSAAVHTVAIASSSTTSTSIPAPAPGGPPPQIPPRKPPSEASASTAAPPAVTAGSTAGTSTATANKRKSAPPVPPPRRGDRDRDRSISPTKLAGNQNTRPGPPPPLPSYPSSSVLPALPLHTQNQPAPHIQHVTTPLMRQSLHAAQIGQSLQKAEARMEKERVMQVLRTSAGPSGAGSGSAGASGASAADAAAADDRDRGRAPPLPQRRPSGRVAPPPPAPGSKPATPGVSTSREARGRQQLPSPPSSMGSMGSMGSMEKVALAGGDLEKRERERLSSRSPTKPPPPPPHPHAQRRRETVSSAGSADAGASGTGSTKNSDGSTSTSTPSRPPPTHPDRARRNLESFEAVYGPTLAFPAHPDAATSTPASDFAGASDRAGVARSPFSPIAGSPSGSGSASPAPSTSRYAFDASEPPATPPGVSPRVFRSKSMHYKPPPPPPAYGSGTAKTTAAGSPFASSSSAAAHGRTSHASPAPPPRPPARKKRPESFQVLSSSSNNIGPGGPFGLVSPTSGTMNAYGVVAAAGYGGSTQDIPASGGLGYVPPAKPFNAFGSSSSSTTTTTTPVRRSSLSVGTAPAVGGRDHGHGSSDRGTERHGHGGRSDGEGERSDTDVFAALAKDSSAASTAKDRPNPIAGLKSTFASANAALLPTLERAREGLDKARYKAEAGLSKRGYMRHNVGYGYASGSGGSGGRGDRNGDRAESSGDDEEAPLSDMHAGEGYTDEYAGGNGEEGIRGAMGGLSIARERERDRTRERQEMAGLVGGVDGRMKAPSAQTKKKQTRPSRDVNGDPAAVAAAAASRTQQGAAYGYGLERDWDSDENGPSVDAGPDVDSDDDDRERGARARRLGMEKDNLKWPAGDGWKPL